MFKALISKELGQRLQDAEIYIDGSFESGRTSHAVIKKNRLVKIKQGNISLELMDIVAAALKHSITLLQQPVYYTP